MTVTKSIPILLLTRIFVIGSLIISISYGQNNNPALTHKDSLLAFSKSDALDTNKPIHLNDLVWEIMYENLDTAIVIGKQALEVELELLKTVKEDEKPIRTSVLYSMAKSNNNLGVCYEFKGDYEVSLWYHLRALEIRTQLKDSLGMGKSYNNIGNVYDSEGNYIKALACYFKALQIFTELRNANRAAGAFTNIGIVYQRMREFDTSLEYLLKALTIFQFIGNKENESQVLCNIGNSYVGKEKYDLAIKYFLDALKLDEASGNQYNIAILFTNLCGVSIQKKEYEQAMIYCEKALLLHNELGISYGIADNLSDMGLLFMQAKNYKKSEEYLKKSLAIATEIGALDLRKANYQALSILYGEINQYKLAFEFHQLFTNAKDSLFNQEKSKEIGRVEAKHEIEAAEIERVQKAKEELRIKTQQRERKNLLQYSGITVLLLIIALSIVLLGVKKVSPVIASGITFFGFLLFFEFLLVLLDPTVDRLSGGEPAYKLLFNAGIAALIFPMHAFFERMLKKRLIKK